MEFDTHTHTHTHSLSLSLSLFRLDRPLAVAFRRRQRRILRRFIVSRLLTSQQNARDDACPASEMRRYRKQLPRYRLTAKRDINKVAAPLEITTIASSLSRRFIT